MKCPGYLVCLAVAFISAFSLEAASNSLTPQEIAEGWILLFGGETTLGWTPRGDAKWAARGGALCSQPGSGAGFLCTTTAFADFQLHAEFWIDDKANSGVFLRCPLSGEITSLNAYEVNIFDAHQKWPTGSISEVAKTPESPRTTGKWNTYELTAEGDHLVVKLNGRTTVDVHDTRHARGVIALQILKEGEVRFRNIKLKPLSS